MGTAAIVILRYIYGPAWAFYTLSMTTIVFAFCIAYEGYNPWMVVVVQSCMFGALIMWATWAWGQLAVLGVTLALSILVFLADFTERIIWEKSSRSRLR